MNLLPYEHFTIRTYLDAKEVFERIDEVTEPKKWFRWPYGNYKPYEGEVYTTEFKVTRIIHYRNSFLPLISGKIGSDLGQTTVEIKMYPHPFVTVFMLVWLALPTYHLLSMVFRIISTWITTGETPPAPTMISTLPMLMFAFVAIVFVGAFKFESIKSTRYFRTLLEDVES